METILHIGLSNAAVAGVLAIVVAGVALVCRKPAVLHGLWLLVLLKLLTPPLVRIPVMLQAAESSAAAPVSGDRVEPVPDRDVLVPVDVPAEEPLVGLAEKTKAASSRRPAEMAQADQLLPAGDLVLELQAQEIPSDTPWPASEFAPTAPQKEPAFAWMLVAAGIWLAGSICWFLLAALRVWRFHRLVRFARPAPLTVQREVHHLASELGLAVVPSAWLLPGKVAPMLWAFLGRARLLLPEDLLERVPVEQLKTLLLHELAHLKRRDHWVRLVEFLARGLYWWHPAVWYACRELREAEEQCCDAWVVTTVPTGGRAYALALVETLDFLSDARPATPLLASGIGHVSDLKRRLTMIMRGTTPRSLTWRGLVALLVLGGLLLPLLPTWAQDGAGEENRAKDPAPKDEVDKAEADLKHLQENLQKKKADLDRQMVELQEAQKRVQEAADKLHRARNVKDGEHRSKPQAQEEPQEIVLRRVGDKWVIVTPKGQPKDVMVIITKDGIPQLPGKEVRWVVTPPGGQPLTPWGPNMQPNPLGHRKAEDRRIEDLEKKLEDMMRELEKMRRELRQGRPNADPTPLRENLPGGPDKPIPGNSLPGRNPAGPGVGPNTPAPGGFPQPGIPGLQGFPMFPMPLQRAPGGAPGQP
jgi:beta-lactamase regulating signal transducer with metallopeptidase domain